MSTQPEALRLAGLLEKPAGSSSVFRNPAAAELRRLHAENKELREANEAFGKRQEWWNSRMANMEAENEAKDVLLRQAWAVIRWQCFGECRTDGVEGLPTPSEIDAAIRQHLEGKA